MKTNMTERSVCSNHTSSLVGWKGKEKERKGEGNARSVVISIFWLGKLRGLGNIYFLPPVKKKKEKKGKRKRRSCSPWSKKSPNPFWRGRDLAWHQREKGGCLDFLLGKEHTKGGLERTGSGQIWINGRISKRGKEFAKDLEMSLQRFGTMTVGDM